MAAATAGGFVGTSALSTSVAADHVAGHPSTEFDMYGIDHFRNPPRLITVSSADLEPPSDPDTSETQISYIDVDLPVGTDGLSLNTLAAHPFEEGDDDVRYLYGTDVYSDRAFKVHPGTGDLTFFGSPDSIVGGIAASAIVIDDNDDPRWYGITHGGVGGGNANKIWEIDLTTGEPSGGAQLTHDGEDVAATHVGMGINFTTDELWGVIADPENTEDSNVFKVLDPTTGEIDIVNDTALTGGRSVGAAFGPCASIMFAMRQGSELYGYNVADDTEFDYGTLVYSSEAPTNFDSLAVPYGIECQDQECEPCELEGSYKFEWVEDEELEGECNGTFVIYDEDDAVVESVDGLEITSVTCDEDGEPTEACFETDYCAIDYEVKAGPETESGSYSDADADLDADSDSDSNSGDFCVSGIAGTTPGGQDVTYAISHVVFSCPSSEETDDSDETENGESDDEDHDKGHGNNDGDDPDNPGNDDGDDDDGNSGHGDDDNNGNGRGR